MREKKNIETIKSPSLNKNEGSQETPKILTKNYRHREL